MRSNIIVVQFLVYLLTLCGTVVWAMEQRAPQPAFTISSQSQPSVTDAVFTRGETLSYTAKLNELPAGDGEIRLRKIQHNGQDAYRVTARGRTSKLVDVLFNIRGEADSLFAASGFSPIVFRFAFTERDRPRELGVRYDATTNTLIGLTKKKERARERREPASAVYDPFSAFYLLRSRNLTPGSTQQIAVFTGKDRYQFTAHIVRQERILLLNNERTAVRLHLEGYKVTDNARKNALPEETTLWVSPDPTHVPLKLESLLPFGQFVVELNGQ